jgi:hypothetical protein
MKDPIALAKQLREEREKEQREKEYKNSSRANDNIKEFKLALEARIDLQQAMVEEPFESLMYCEKKSEFETHYSCKTFKDAKVWTAPPTLIIRHISHSASSFIAINFFNEPSIFYETAIEGDTVFYYYTDKFRNYDFSTGGGKVKVTAEELANKYLCELMVRMARYYPIPLNEVQNLLK